MTSNTHNCPVFWHIITSIYFVSFLKVFCCFVQVKSEGPKLVPFFKATCVYFVLWLPTSSPSWFSALIKCLPIFCLWVFLLAHGISFLVAHSSARKIFAGLIFSALGDAFLIWQEQGYFSHGKFTYTSFDLCSMMLTQVRCSAWCSWQNPELDYWGSFWFQQLSHAAYLKCEMFMVFFNPWHLQPLFITGLLMFAITHILYSSAFGMKPLNLRAGLVIGTISGLCYTLLYPYLSGTFTYLVAVYIALIGFMGWRAIAGVQLANDLWTWTKLSACLGAVLFMVSDLTIAVNKFCFPVPHSRAIIMATYYAAQMLIALSAVECQDADVARKRVWGA